MRQGKLVMQRMSEKLERVEMSKRKIAFGKHQVKVSSKVKAGKGNPKPYQTSKKKTTKIMQSTCATTAAHQLMNAVPV